MQWIKNNKKYVLIAVVLGLVGIFALIHATKMRIERAAKLSCVVQYDEMMGGIEVNEEISEMLHQKKDAFCNCWTGVVMKDWTDYALMRSVDVATELVKNAPEEATDCIQVFF